MCVLPEVASPDRKVRASKLFSTLITVTARLMKRPEESYIGIPIFGEWYYYIYDMIVCLCSLGIILGAIYPYICVVPIGIIR